MARSLGLRLSSSYTQRLAGLLVLVAPRPRPQEREVLPEPELEAELLEERVPVSESAREEKEVSDAIDALLASLG